MTEKEYTKIVNRKCQDCGKLLSILCNERCQIVAVRCPDCFQTFLISTIEVEQLRSYLKKNGWEELSCERKEAIKVRSPKGFITMIPAIKDLIGYGYIEYTKHALTSIAIYEDKTFDELLSEVLKGVGEQEETWIKIWEEECDGRCAILHLERCHRYEDGECKFPDTQKAKEIVDEAKGQMRK